MLVILSEGASAECSYLVAKIILSLVLSSAVAVLSLHRMITIPQPYIDVSLSSAFKAYSFTVDSK